jgi:hypothetical protein
MSEAINYGAIPWGPHRDPARPAARTYVTLRACYTVLSQLDRDPLPSDADLWAMAQAEARSGPLPEYTAALQAAWEDQDAPWASHRPAWSPAERHGADAYAAHDRLRDGRGDPRPDDWGHGWHVLPGPRGVAYEGEPMSRDRRLRRFEWQVIRQLTAEAGKPYGFRADDMLDDARRLVARSEAEQEAEFADAVAQAQARGDHAAVCLLTDGWAAVRRTAEHSWLGCPPWALMTAEGVPCSVTDAFEVRWHHE